MAVTGSLGGLKAGEGVSDASFAEEAATLARSTHAGKTVLVLGSLCFIGGTAVTVTDILMRFAAGSNLPGAIEATALLVGLGAVISIPACYAYQGHVTAKLLSEIAPHLCAVPLGFFGTLLSALFAVLMFAILAVSLSEKIGSAETTGDLGLTVWMLFAIVTAAAGIGVLASFRALLAGGASSKVSDIQQ